MTANLGFEMINDQKEQKRGEQMKNSQEMEQVLRWALEQILG